MLRSTALYSTVALGVMLTTATAALAASRGHSASASEGARASDAAGRHDGAYDWKYNDVCQYDTQYFRVGPNLHRHPC